jgi:radical SAM family uncharacterized protein/radical SAM-linked protein
MTKQSILPFVTKPGRYIGNEFNTIKKDWQTSSIRFALIFPDLYEIGMSHFGLQILYHLLNNQEDILAERCFAPDIDAEKVMVEKSVPLQSLESGKPLNSFDVLGITLPYELCYTNILTILDLAGIPKYSCDRAPSHPIILGGGSCSLNPEPVAEFFDAILLGDGEEAVVEIAETIKKAKNNDLSKKQTLENLSKIQGIYIPAEFSTEYDDTGALSSIHNTNKNFQQVERRIVKNLDATSHLCQPIVPNAKIVHDRLGIEIARGCTRGCRFCQAGMIYRPVRERTVDQIFKLADDGIGKSGFEELALLSLSTGDHSCINDILPRLMDRFADENVSVSMPSMRVGTLSHTLMDQIKRVRKTGFTVAPEAGSERLRQVINKGITEEDLLTTCKDAFRLGWNTIKLYFMIGLPTETMDDIDAIADLTKKIKDVAAETGNRRNQVTVSVGTFVPKPHTPFQWQQQLTLDESRERIQYLKQVLPRKGVKFKWHDPQMSFLEGVFSRGDRNLAKLIETAWSLGARLDGWSDHFQIEIWQQAAEECGLDLTRYLRARKPEEVLPWQHLSSGLDPDFFVQEMDKALSGTYTPDCRYHGCQSCGLCDFSTLMPIVHGSGSETESQLQKSPEAADKKSQENHYKYVVNYSRTGDISYLGHLEILQIVFRSLKRARIRTNFSKGFNPSPKVSFGAALPVGMESEAEFFIMDLPEPLHDTDFTRNLLNNNLPPGIKVTEITLHSGKIPQSVLNTYTISMPRPFTEQEKHSIHSYLDSAEFLVSRIRKGKTKQIDIRPLLQDIQLIREDTLEITIISTAGTPGVKVEEALAHICLISKNELLRSAFKKTAWKQINTN